MKWLSMNKKNEYTGWTGCIIIIINNNNNNK